MGNIRVSLLVACLLLVLSIASATVPCAFTSEAGHKFDFCSISFTHSVYEDFVYDEGIFVYYVNLAAEVVEASGWAECEGCSVCQVEKDGETFKNAKCAGKTETQELGDIEAPWVPGDGFFAGYFDGTETHTGNARHSIINVKCNATLGSVGIIRSIVENATFHGAYAIRMESPFACPEIDPVSSECTFVASDGSYFDLSHLTKHVGFDYLTNWAGEDYFINVCHSTLYAGDAEYACQGCGVCQIDQQGTNAHCAGQVVNPPEFAQADPSDPGKGVVLTYTNGTTCHNGQQRTSVLTFLCDPSAENLIFSDVKEDTHCIYEFKFFSKYACPDNPSPPQTCHFTTKEGDFYDLTPLAILDGSEMDYEYDTAAHFYSINICQDVTHPAAECHHCEACQTDRDGESFCLGDTSTMVIAEKADPKSGVQITVTGGSECHSNHTERSTIIDLKCNPDAKVAQIVSVTEEGYCSYRVVMESSVACPITTPWCSYQASDGSLYDLTKLRMAAPKTDFKFNDTEEFESYFVNFCAPTVYSSSHCNGTCSVCQIDTSGGNSHCAGLTSTMRFSEIPDMPDQGVMVTYVHGDKCSNNQLRSSILKLECDLKEEGKFTSIDERLETECIYEMVFKTKYACPKTPTHENCTHTTSDGWYYDLNPLQALAGNDLMFADPTAKTVTHINFCADTITYDPICNDCGMCVEPAPTDDDGDSSSICGGKNVGFTFSDYTKPTQGVVLSYHSGSTCSGQTPYTTSVYAECDRMASPGYVDSVTKSGCTYNVVVKSKYACPLNYHSDCSYTYSYSGSGTTWNFDLSRLPRYAESVNPEDYKYYDYADHLSLYYNPCTYTIVGEDEGCGDCSVCLYHSVSGRYVCGGSLNTQAFSAIGATAADVAPTGIRASYSYNHTTTNVNMHCAPLEFDSIGNVKVTGDFETVDVDFYSQWACPTASGAPYCTHTAKDGSLYDLTDLIVTSGFDHQFNDNTTDEYYYINVCHETMVETDKCQACGVCQADAGSLESSHCCGTLESMKMSDHPDGPNKGLVMRYSGGDVCRRAGVARDSQITFSCDFNIGRGGILSIDEKEEELCQYDMVFASIFACPYNSYTYTSPGGWHYDLKPIAIFPAKTTVASYRYYPDSADKSKFFLLNIVNSIVENIVGCHGCGTCYVENGKGACLGRVGEDSTFVDIDNDREGLEIDYKDGDLSPSRQKYVTKIKVLCKDQDSTTFDQMTLLSDSTTYEAVVHSYDACPTNPQCGTCAHGTCRRTSECLCDSDYHGTNCDEKKHDKKNHHAAAVITAVAVSTFVGIAFIVLVSSIAICAVLMILIKFIYVRARPQKLRFERYEDEGIPGMAHDLEDTAGFADDYVPEEDDVDMSINTRAEVDLDLEL